MPQVGIGWSAYLYLSCEGFLLRNTVEVIGVWADSCGAFAALWEAMSA